MRVPILVLFLVGCSQSDIDNEPVRTRDEAMAEAGARSSGPSTDVCNIAYDSDGNGSNDATLIAIGEDADADGEAVIPTNPSDIFDDGQYACADGVVNGFVVVTAVGNDCNDTPITGAAINPAATEVCDGVDNNCDGSVDEAGGATTWYADSDSDTFGNASASSMACSAPDGYVADSSDCNDTVTAINPAAMEVCNGVDDDCNDGIDEGVLSTFYADVDIDGFGDPTSSAMACSAPSGYIAEWTDCDDMNGDINPGVVEDCDSVDNDCSGTVDDNLTTDSVGVTQSYVDGDGDSYGAGSSLGLVCTIEEGYSANNTDCEDTIWGTNPGATDIPGDGIDQDCSGADTPAADPDSDGDTYPASVDCDDSNGAINPGAMETCNGMDDDCDIAVDEGVTSTFYADTDGDGYGDAASTAMACSASSGWVANSTDCDDGDVDVNPGEVETSFNGTDDNCDLMANPTAVATIVVTPNPSQMTVPWELWIRNRTVDPDGETTATWETGGAASGTGALTTTVTLVDGDVEAINGPFNGGSYWAFMIGTTNVSTTFTVDGYSFVATNTCWDGTYTCTTGGTDAWWTVDTL
ncbi:MAG: putative metal-binding motif-containing protein [Patescibacteria group bacterium]